MRRAGRSYAVREPVVVSPEVAGALRQRRPVVALETTLAAHGFPPGQGLAVGQDCEERIRGGGAVPATVAVLDGAVRVGLTAAELERVAAAGAEARKGGPRDLPACGVQGGVGATTARRT